MMFLHSARPMPLPLTLDEKNPSNSFSCAWAWMPRPLSSMLTSAMPLSARAWMRSKRRSTGRSAISSIALNARLRITWPISTFSQLTRSGSGEVMTSTRTRLGSARRLMK
ncbi:hypothetical protein D3C73_1496520 [compost metagenome]